MTSIEKAASEISVGDVALISIGNGKVHRFRIDSTRTNRTSTGKPVYTFYSDEYLPIGMTGPCAFTLLDGDTVEIIAA